MTQRSLFLLMTLLVSSACDCSSDPECMVNTDCDDAICVDGMCLLPNDTGVDAPLGDTGRDTNQPDTNMVCESAVFCGQPPVCCALGTECVDEQCLPVCETGVRCGQTCCGSATDVCISGSCTAPGENCGDSFDCPAGQFCEPTLGQCIPQFDPVTCESEPNVNDFNVTPELELTSFETRPACSHPISMPVTIDLDSDGVPTILVNMVCDDRPGYTVGVLRALRGDTGVEEWIGEVDLYGRISIAAGDIDADGDIEIAGLTPDGRPVLFDHTGAVVWYGIDDGAQVNLSTANAAPTLADLDGDGQAEVLWGATAFNNAGQLLWQSGQGVNEGTNQGYTGGIAVVVDVDADGVVDVVTGARVWNNDGTLKFEVTAEGAAVADGLTAVAQFDADPQAEIVLVAAGNVYVLDGIDGSIQWGPTALVGSGRGGPPTVADFDGDGAPEIGVAGGENYIVFDLAEADGVLWSRPTRDRSSNATGSSVFDFEGDGRAEVVYQDECNVWVYSGVDGSTFLQLPSSSATIHEYPTVVDVDGDGNSELVTVANSRGSVGCSNPGQREGVYVYGDVSDRWVGTRRIWNQHAYNVVNVTSSGGIPASPQLNWSVPGLNNFRQNTQGEAALNAADLVADLSVNLNGCPEITLLARVQNVGNLGVFPGVPVEFFRGTIATPGESLGVAMTTRALLPGASELVQLQVPLGEDVPASFHVVVNGQAPNEDEAVVECDGDNNGAELTDVSCSLLM